MTAPVVARSAQRCWSPTLVQEGLEQPTRLEHKSQGRAHRVRLAFAIASLTAIDLCILHWYLDSLAGQPVALGGSLVLENDRPPTGGRLRVTVLLHRKAAAAERLRLLGGIGPRVGHL